MNEVKENKTPEEIAAEAELREHNIHQLMNVVRPLRESPSPYGSHAVMVDDELTGKLKSEDRVICRDEFGTYETDRKRLDNGLSDPVRMSLLRDYKFPKKKEDDKGKKKKK